MIDKEKLNGDGSNYADWIRSLRILLRNAKKDYVLTTPLPVAPTAEATVAEQNVYQTKLDDCTAGNAELTMQADPNYTLAVSKTTSFKKRGKYKGKATGKSSAKTKKKPSGTGPNKDTECFYCKAKGHWKRNYKKYLADRKKPVFTCKGIKVIHVIDVFLSGPHSKSWVFDTGVVAHICN